MWLSAGISPVQYALDLVKVSEDTASLLVCTRKKFLLGECGFFVSDVISGGLLGYLAHFARP